MIAKCTICVANSFTFAESSMLREVDLRFWNFDKRFNHKYIQTYCLVWALRVLRLKL